MGHQLAFTAAGEAMFAYNERTGPPWHALGKGRPGLATGAEMMADALLNWLVYHTPVQDDLGAVIAGYKTCCRDDELGTRHHLGIVLPDWQAMQNHQLFALLDRIVGAGFAVYETAGALFDGRMVFVSMDPSAVPGMSIDLPNGEQLRTWIVATNGHDGHHKLDIFTATVRPVCWNTVQAARSTALSIFTARHTSGIEERVAEIRDQLALRFNAVQVLRAECQKLVETPATDDVTTNWVDWLFRPDEAPEGPARTKRQDAADTVVELAMHGRGNDGKTLWSWYNGYTEFLEGLAPKTRRANRQYAADTRLVSTLMGDMQAKRETARAQLLELAGVPVLVRK